MKETGSFLLNTKIDINFGCVSIYEDLMYQNMCEALTYLLDNIFIRFGMKLYRQIAGIPMGTNCAPLMADLFLICYERDFMASFL